MVNHAGGALISDTVYSHQCVAIIVSFSVPHSVHSLTAGSRGPWLPWQALFGVLLALRILRPFGLYIAGFGPGVSVVLVPLLPHLCSPATKA